MTMSELAGVQKEHQAEASALQEQLSVHQEAAGIHPPPPPPFLSKKETRKYHLVTPQQAFWVYQGCKSNSEADAYLHHATD